ncbi:MAG: hypothetical protein IKW98_00115 [Prevotella sp.]|nr:hypothetical protein [Prevotella sp.]
MKKNKMESWKWKGASVHLLAVFVLLFLMGCNSSPNPSKGTEAASDSTAKVVETDEVSGTNEEEAYMAAPKIETDGQGLITLGQCPMTDKHLEVKLSEDNDKADIYYDGKLIQTVEDKEGSLVAAGGDIPVRFLDANFDGMTDIFIGPGESRTYSTLLIWNPACEEFVRIGSLGEPSLQGFILEPGTKSIYEGGSGSYCLFVMTRSVWDGGNLKEKEKLLCVSDPTQYKANEVSGKYSLRDDKDKEIQATEILTELPRSWTNIVNIYGLE